MRFYSEEQVQRITDELEKAVTIPVNIEIEAEHRVYDFSEIKEILEKAGRIAVQNCGCKREYGNCDAPREICISLDETVNELLEKGTYPMKDIDVNEALEVLRRSHEAGLVHMAYTKKGGEKPFLICSCCPCCCHTLGSLVRRGLHTQILTSKYIAANDTERCINCGRCMERCVFQARRMKNGELFYDKSRCFGCGLCISTCRMEAISLVPRKV
jgi:Pyruvate/2-oxoacid:ferredoxin oxidoreductase delta subunit